MIRWNKMDREAGVSATQAELSEKVPLLTSEWDLRAMRQTAMPRCRWRAFQPEGTASGKAQRHQRAWWAWGTARRPMQLCRSSRRGSSEKNQHRDGAGHDRKAWKPWKGLRFYSERNGMTLESLWHWTGMIRSHFGFNKRHVECCVEKAKGQG